MCTADGPAAALAIIETLANGPALQSYHRPPATRADFLRRLNRYAEAAIEYRRALTLVSNDRERDFLTKQLARCESSSSQARNALFQNLNPDVSTYR